MLKRGEGFKRTVRATWERVPSPVRNWFSYYRRGSRFTPLEFTRVRSRILDALAPALLAEAFKDEELRNEFQQRLRLAILRAGYLGLHRQLGYSIVDLGTGPGFFIAVSKHLGHDCIGLDLPNDRLSAETVRRYEAFLKVLDCESERRTLAVEPFQPLNLPERVDLITAGLVCFNEYPSGRLWSRAEWEFFLSDVATYLKPGGRVFLELNAYPQFGRLRWYDEPTAQLFASRCRVLGNRIQFRSPEPNEQRATSLAASTGLLML
jgi:SAM-dependent methyltransferase